MLIQVNEPNPDLRVLEFHLVSTDGISPALDEEDEQPKICLSTDHPRGWRSDGIGPLESVGEGGYYAELSMDVITMPGVLIRSLYSSLRAATIPGSSAQVVGFNPKDPKLGANIEGANSILIECRDANNQEVPFAMFSIVGIGSAIANSHGKYNLGLNNGDYTLNATSSSGLLFPTTQATVNGPRTITLLANSANILPPILPQQTLAYTYTRDLSGALQPGVTMFVQLLDPPSPFDAWPGQSYQGNSDLAGYFSVTLRKDANYRVRRGPTGKWVPFRTGLGSTYILPPTKSGT